MFLNRLDQPLTRYGIYGLVRRTVEEAGQNLPSLKTKRISPHCLRHTCAVFLLRSGVDINTIRAWLGHVSLDTTHVYAEVDLEMKAKGTGSLRSSRGGDNEALAYRQRSDWFLKSTMTGQWLKSYVVAPAGKVVPGQLLLRWRNISSENT